jgi:hypothetical protein
MPALFTYLIIVTKPSGRVITRVKRPYSSVRSLEELITVHFPAALKADRAFCNCRDIGQYLYIHFGCNLHQDKVNGVCN